jgi:flavin reductase (DIM6/NTAB) family NADH-FMN oxidoreductase RutF
VTAAATTSLPLPGGSAPDTELTGPARRPESDVPPTASPGKYRAVMRHHAKGVAIITAGTKTPTGFCATSLASVSLDPPLVSFTVGLHATSWSAMRTARYVMVHLLADDQEDLARRFAQPGGEKFGPSTRWHRGPHGLPLLDDVLACLTLAPIRRILAGDHVLVINRVTAAWHQADGSPLIHHDGKFARFAAPHRTGTPDQAAARPAGG